MHNDNYLWDPKAPADSEIARIEEALRPLRLVRPELSFDNIHLQKWRPWAWAVAAALTILLAGGYSIARLTVDPWAVRALVGSATVDRSRVDANARIDSRIAEGQWLETDARSTAEINIGRIGRAAFGPGSRVQLVRAESREHRLSLVRGTMHARVWAPPRFFLVQTATALAVDLGCVYTLTVDEQGAGELSVESGEVELVAGTRRVSVPAGNVVSMRPVVGPGLPMRKLSSPEFQLSVRTLELDFGNASALDRVLSLSTPTTSITLWHLLQRVPVADRERVYARLADFASPPEGVQRSAIIGLESGALGAWKKRLEPGWTIETIPAWKRAWRKAWTLALTFG